MKLRDLKNSKERRAFVEKETGISLDEISTFSFDEETVSSRNCENFIGAVHVPLGVAGPLQIKSEKGKRENYYVPLATTEGALVASVSRGCKAIRESGGAEVLVEPVGATRGSVFETKGIVHSQELEQWFARNLKKLRTIAQSTSNHLSLLKTDAQRVGTSVFVRFYYDTQDAMGLNMVTIATSALVPFIEKETRSVCVSLAGNFDVDKKPAWLNVLSGRGKRVWAEIIVQKEIVKNVLKSSPDKICKVAHKKYLLGSILSGSLGFNGHYANSIAALFIATGQDPAHVVEGSLGITTAELTKEGDLYFSVYLPDLMVGTIGGGTGLATQKKALEMLGVYGGNKGKNAVQFAKIIGATILAGELSLTASLAEGSLACAHKALARGIKA
jgi:hydroxymethylglutaryl-CoA reductase (NADPH)